MDRTVEGDAPLAGGLCDGAGQVAGRLCPPPGFFRAFRAVNNSERIEHFAEENICTTTVFIRFRRLHPGEKHGFSASLRRGRLLPHPPERLRDFLRKRSTTKKARLAQGFADFPEHKRILIWRRERDLNPRGA
ncbi:hypothetical protein [uncultured Desulfovibrio sp.]|uniref:hypothetical protein n=1 Tax=uncultured Desulfovibrio sp. TaxID=167968 RepID=UPI00262842D9|nr:hypothetical protein [uncultured Desulfovibrio sp.]